MAKRKMQFDDLVSERGENSNGVTLVTPNTDQVGDDYIGRTQWPWGNRDGDRFRAWGDVDVDLPSAVPIQQKSRKR